MAIKQFQGINRFLSNFWPCPVRYDNNLYPSSENAYQAMKTLDIKEKEKISKMTPGESKRYARTIPLRSDWEEIKLRIMEEIVRAKFTQNIHLAIKLANTGDQELIEGNTWNDFWWGVCRGKGENHLGKILMKVRNELQWEGSTCDTCGKAEVKNGVMAEHDNNCPDRP